MAGREGLTQNAVQKLWRGLTWPKALETKELLLELQALKDMVVQDLESGENRDFVHVAEGRANVVYRIVDRSSSTQLYEGSLVRVGKKTPGAVPHSYERLQQYREGTIEPALGREFLVPQLLFRINADQARQLNEKRDPNHQNESHIEPGFAMLIQDMTPSDLELGMEFKPKWLAQSPLAPLDARRCRTCAREAYRNSLKLKKGEPVTPPTCPLGLINDDRPDIVLGTLEDLEPSWSDADRQRLKAALDRTQVLHKLRKLQIDGDPAMPGDTMFTKPEDPSFGLAMTLRDCTCFVRMSKDASVDGVEIKFADVDEKNWVSKAQYWQESHANLVASGFYHKTEEPLMETKCLFMNVQAKDKDAH